MRHNTSQFNYKRMSLDTTGLTKQQLVSAFSIQFQCRQRTLFPPNDGTDAPSRGENSKTDSTKQPTEHRTDSRPAERCSLQVVPAILRS